MSTLRILLLLALVVSISAASLQRRQISIGSVAAPPSQCSSTCAPVNNEISLGCPVTACCTTTFETQYYNCLDCVGTALDASSYAAAQSNLNLLYMTCVDMGFVLSPLALPGQTASSSNSSASGAATALFPTSSSGAGSSGTSTHATGAAVSGRRHGAGVGALIGAAALLWFAALW